MQRQVHDHVIKIMFLFSGFIIFVILLSHSFSRKLEKEFTVFTMFFKEAAAKHKSINKESLNILEFRDLTVSVNKMIQDRKRSEEALRKAHDEEEKSLFVYYEERSSIPAIVKGDERKLWQVLLNLLNNAVKYTEQGGVTLRVRLLDGEMGSWGDREIGSRGDREQGR